MPNALRSYIRNMRGKWWISLAARAVRDHVPQTGPVTVVGFLHLSVGLGHGARMIHGALTNLKYDVRYVDITKYFPWIENVEVDLGKAAQVGEGGSVIIILNGGELAYGLLSLGRNVLQNKKLIAHWVWELEAIPDNWVPAAKLMDEIWAPTKFVADAIEKKLHRSVRIVPYPVIIVNPSARNRRSFNIDENAIVFLTMFDARSGVVRKNPQASIAAFKKTFGEDAGACLVLKIAEYHAAPALMQELYIAAANATNIIFIMETLSTQDIAALVECADVIVSLHRAEGFGLVLAEAMLRNKVVMATSWSGNMDFMNSDNSALVDYQLVPVNDAQGIYTESDMFWAEPDIEHASAWMNRLASDDALRMTIGENARRTTQEYFSLDNFQQAVGDGLRI